MLYRISIIFIVTAIATSLHSMNEATLVNKSRTYSTKNLIKQLPVTHSLIEELRFAHHIVHKKSIPKEIANHIVLYSAVLKNQDFENKVDPFVYQWHQFKIPPSYSYFLNQKQYYLIKSLITSEPLEKKTFIKNQVIHLELYYTLPSKKDYKLFLTIPIELRRRLCYKPLRFLSSELHEYDETCVLKEHCYICNRTKINNGKKIKVKRKHSCEYKYIVPEDDNPKK
jgi:hypothetical protein